ncbi:hypothetical protein, partial [Ruegeria arenilitoris]|uniref:hypothetical protein n=1 Tax=Ruegeria arenilitoris TaxID=1173585 RepID=UPI001C2CA6C2
MRSIVIRRNLAIGLLLWALASVQAAAEAVRIVVISDLNGSYGSVKYDARVGKAIKRIIEIDPDLVI